MTQQNVEASAAPDPLPQASPPPTLTPTQLFFAFNRMSMSGFGGVIPVAYHHLVERQRWLSPTEFVELVAFSQMLPGPGICNMSVILGYRFAGLRGAAASLAGMIFGPFLTVVFAAILYRQYSDLALVRQAVAGMSVVAAALIASMSIKMLRNLPRKWLPMGFVALALLGLGVLRWPLIIVFAILAPLAVLIAWKRAP